VIVLFVLAMHPCHAFAQPVGRDGVLWQTRSCIGEIGFVDVDACVAMTYVHMRRAASGGVSLSWMARHYSRAIRVPRRPWVLGLRADGRKGADWPRTASWDARRDRSLAMFEAVRGAIAGTIPDPCPGAMHYGSRHLDRNPNPARWERSSCLPESRQQFFVRRSQ
jgi:hypothetical protein